MGELLTANCSSCGLHAEDLCVGEGPSPIHVIVWRRIHYCAGCEVLHAAPTLLSPEHIRARVTAYENMMDIPSSELGALAEQIAEALECRCRKCSGKLKVVRWSPRKRVSSCPRCKKQALELALAGIWD